MNGFGIDLPLPVEAQALVVLCHPGYRLDTFVAHRDELRRIVGAVDGYRLLDLCRRHRLTGLMAWRGEQLFGGLVPRTVRRDFMSQLLFHAERNVRLVSEGARLQHAAASVGMRMLPRKGLVLAPGCYPCLGVRELGDLDFFVRPEDRQLAREMAQSLGYREGKLRYGSRKVEPRSRVRQLYWRYYMGTAPMMFRPSDDPYVESFALDLRWRVFERGHGATLDIETLFRACPDGGSYGTGTCWDVHYLAIDICVHARREADTLESVSQNKALTLSRLIDALLICRRPDFSGERFLELAEEIGCIDDVARVARHSELFSGKCSPASGLATARLVRSVGPGGDL
jgi:hypothetical protein